MQGKKNEIKLRLRRLLLFCSHLFLRVVVFVTSFLLLCCSTHRLACSTVSISMPCRKFCSPKSILHITTYSVCSFTFMSAFFENVYSLFFALLSILLLLSQLESLILSLYFMQIIVIILKLTKLFLALLHWLCVCVCVCVDVVLQFACRELSLSIGGLMAQETVWASDAYTYIQIDRCNAFCIYELLHRIRRCFGCFHLFCMHVVKRARLPALALSHTPLCTKTNLSKINNKCPHVCSAYHSIAED